MKLLLALIPLGLALFVAVKVFRAARPSVSSDSHDVLQPCPHCGGFVHPGATRCPHCDAVLFSRLRLALSAFFGTLIAAGLLVLFLYLLGFALMFALYIAIGAGIAMLIGWLIRQARGNPKP